MNKPSQRLQEYQLLSARRFTTNSPLKCCSHMHRALWLQAPGASASRKLPKPVARCTPTERERHHRIPRSPESKHRQLNCSHCRHIWSRSEQIAPRPSASLWRLEPLSANNTQRSWFCYKQLCLLMLQAPRLAASRQPLRSPARRSPPAQSAATAAPRSVACPPTSSIGCPPSTQSPSWATAASWWTAPSASRLWLWSAWLPCPAGTSSTGSAFVPGWRDAPPAPRESRAD